MAGSPSCGQNERPRIWCVIVQADREMLAFNDHPARRWEPERLGLLLFSIAARITSHAWRTYYGFPTRTLGAPARRPGPTSGPALTNLTSHQTDPTGEERTPPGPRNRRHPTSRTHIHAPTPATRSLPPNPKPIKPARLPRETSRPSGTQRFCGRSNGFDWHFAVCGWDIALVGLILV